MKTVEGTRKMPLMDLPIRSCVFELTDTRVLVAPASTLTREELRARGPVDVIVATNLFHTEGIAQAAAENPRAQLWGPVGAKERQPGLSWSGILGSDEWPFGAELALVTLDGMPKVNESVLVHRASRTLHASDLAFNIREPGGLGASVLLSLFGTRGRFGVSRLFSMMVKDDSAFRDSFATLFALDFDRLVPPHGTSVEADAKHVLREALTERGFRIR